VPDEKRVIIDRANRMLRQSKTLRKLSEELLQESHDIRDSANQLKPKRQRPKGRAPK
jgi:hypothetical protein